MSSSSSSSSSSHLRKPFARMGGKTVLSRILLQHLPVQYREMRYVEVFAGGASLYFAKEPSLQEVLNDIDDSVVILLRGFRKYNGEVIAKKVNSHCSKNTFFNIKQFTPQDEFEIFIKTLLLNKHSYLGKSISFADKQNNSHITNEYNNRMKDTVITQLDYIECINKYDSKSTLFYLDPPYENSNKSHYDNYRIDYNTLSNILSKIVGKFLLSINNSEYIKDTFKQFNIVVIDDVYYSSNKSFKSELIISNY
jgi:DNA adenine methylase